MRQRTIKHEIYAAGIGLHSGKPCAMTLRPAAVNTGIVFRRVDLPNQPHVKAEASSVRDTQLCTAMVVDGVRVATIEHFMSALAGLGVDNLYIDLDSAEVPIMDGSAAPFVYLLQQAGICEQDESKRFIKILESIEVRDGDKWARLLPFDGYRIDFTILFNHAVFRHRNKYYRLDFSTQRYIREICRARTFGFLRDIEYLHSNGLALGGSLDNAVVVDDYRVLNEQGLRFDDEFVRHKLLDAIGDLYLLGAPILGWYQGYKSGHDLNNKLALAVIEHGDCWQWHELEQDSAEQPVVYEDLLSGDYPLLAF